MKLLIFLVATIYHLSALGLNEVNLSRGVKINMFLELPQTQKVFFITENKELQIADSHGNKTDILCDFGGEASEKGIRSFEDPIYLSDQGFIVGYTSFHYSQPGYGDRDGFYSINLKNNFCIYHSFEYSTYLNGPYYSEFLKRVIFATHYYEIKNDGTHSLLEYDPITDIQKIILNKKTDADEIYFNSIQLSPDGRFLSFVNTAKKRSQQILVLLNLEDNQTSQLASYMHQENSNLPQRTPFNLMFCKVPSGSPNKAFISEMDSSLKYVRFKLLNLNTQERSVDSGFPTKGDIEVFPKANETCDKYLWTDLISDSKSGKLDYEKFQTLFDVKSNTVFPWQLPIDGELARDKSFSKFLFQRNGYNSQLELHQINSNEYLRKMSAETPDLSNANYRLVLTTDNNFSKIYVFNENHDDWGLYVVNPSTMLFKSIKTIEPLSYYTTLYEIRLSKDEKNIFINTDRGLFSSKL